MKIEETHNLYDLKYFTIEEIRKNVTLDKISIMNILLQGGRTMRFYVGKVNFDFELNNEMLRLDMPTKEGRERLMDNFIALIMQTVMDIKAGKDPERKEPIH